jgi:hypothetical protein
MNEREWTQRGLKQTRFYGFISRPIAAHLFRIGVLSSFFYPLLHPSSIVLLLVLDVLPSQKGHLIAIRGF